MKRLPFRIAKGRLMGCSDAAYLDENEPLTGGLVAAAVQALSTDIFITVADHTMFLAAWEDPEHWAEDWAQELGVDFDAVPAAVEALLAGVVTEG